MIILGIDPGTVRVGFGVVASEKGVLACVARGILPLPPAEGSARLSGIERELELLLSRHRPDRVGIERLFFAKNKKTALAVAEARGVLVNTILKHGIPLVELTPNEVKVAVTGSGTASKQGVAKMVSLLLRVPVSSLLDDATDALAVAIGASQQPLY
jgi:crossover junction endodeoxyribonuclease RuvC